MSKTTLSQTSRLETRDLLLASMVAVGVIVAAGMSGCGGSGGLVVGQAAPGLADFDEQNAYSPYFATTEMNFPRYMHKTYKLASGFIFVIGGSDENGFSAIDACEFFDQGALKAGEKEPESKRGTWYDTDFEGNPISLALGRVLHTVTGLPDSKIIVVGGSPNLTAALPFNTAEVYDPLTRTFDQLEETMVHSRFRHAATDIGDGKIMFSGGQIHTLFSQSQQVLVVGGGQQGQQTIQQQIDIFPSSASIEVFDIKSETFDLLRLPSSARAVELTPSRGRAGHTVARIAGPDNRLNTGDDLFVFIGGYQTLSGENAPQSKFPGVGQGVTNGFGGAGAHVSLEFYDPVLRVVSEALNVRMQRPRINDPQATNLGVHSNRTPDGVDGMGNCILVCCGDDNEPLGSRETAIESEVFVAFFENPFGPGQGVEFFKQPDFFFEHSMGNEFFVAQGNIPETGPGEAEPLIGRSQTNIVVLPRKLPSSSGRDLLTSWVFAGGGVHLYEQFFYFNGSIAAGTLFDPFYSIAAVKDFDSSARDLRPGRRDGRNDTGIVGSWLVVDGFIPTVSLAGFGDTPTGDYAVMKAGARVWASNVAVAGADGIDDTVDDRVLLSGGGLDPYGPGGEPSFPSSEILVIPGTGADN